MAAWHSTGAPRIQRGPAARKAVAAVLFIACTLLAVTRVHAPRREYLQSEMGKLLPEWCISTRDGYYDEDGPWSEVFGEGWTHLHHYCRGMHKFNLGMKNLRDPMLRRNYISDSIGEFSYVLTNTSSRFFLRPELLVRRGQAMMVLGRDVEAFQQFQEAISLREDYAPAYAMLSNFYLRKDDRQSAREILELGLTHAPDSKVLLRKLADVKSPGASSPD